MNRHFKTSEILTRSAMRAPGLFCSFCMLVTLVAAGEPTLHFKLPPRGNHILPRDELCLRYVLTNNLTDVIITTDDPLPKQTLSVRIEDNYGNLLRSRENLPETNSKITFMPVLNSIIDICLVNQVRDFSWSYKRRSREVSLRVYQRDGAPRYMPRQKKELASQLLSTHNLLKAIVRKQLRESQSLFADSIQREQELRDLNEDSLDAMTYALVVFAIACFVFQLGSFAILRMLAKL